MAGHLPVTPMGLHKKQGVPHLHLAGNREKRKVPGTTRCWTYAKFSEWVSQWNFRTFIMSSPDLRSDDRAKAYSKAGPGSIPSRHPTLSSSRWRRNLSSMEICSSLKGQCHEIFCFWSFSWVSFPPAPQYPIRTVSNFFENSRRCPQVKVTGGKIWKKYQAADSLLKLTWRQKFIYMLTLLPKGVQTK